MDAWNNLIITLANIEGFRYATHFFLIPIMFLASVLGLFLMDFCYKAQGRKLIQASILAVSAALVVIVATMIVCVIKVGMYELPSEGRMNYVTQEHGLAALNNSLDSTTTKESRAGFFTYVSKTTVDEEIVYNVILEVEDENGREYLDLRTLNEADVRIYQDNAMEPKMVEHYSHEKVLNEVTGEWYYVDEQFEYIELVVPEGSVVENYTIDASNM